MKVQINKIKPDLNQPRKTFKEVEGLARTIKTEGMLQPILIDQNYQIIDGERRYRAAKLIGMKEIPVVIANIKEKNKRLIWQCIEDVQHHDIPILERDQAWLKLWKSLGKIGVREMAKILGVSSTTIQDGLERARFVGSVQHAERLPAARSITELRGLDKEIREKAAYKMAKEGLATDEQVRTFVGRLKSAKSKEEQETIIREPVSDFTKTANRVITACEIIIKYLNRRLMANIPPQQVFILTGYLEDLEKHLKTYKVEDANAV